MSFCGVFSGRMMVFWQGRETHILMSNGWLKGVLEEEKEGVRNAKGAVSEVVRSSGLYPEARWLEPTFGPL